MTEFTITDLPSTRKEAIKNSAKFYCTGKLCKRGHLSQRRTSDGRCLSCEVVYNHNGLAYGRKWESDNRDKVLASEQKSRELRKKIHNGATRYFTGLPCAKGHVAERFVSDRSCLACKLANTKKWFGEHKYHKKSYDQNYGLINRAAKSSYMKQWSKKNPTKVSIQGKNNYALRKRKGARTKLKKQHLDLMMKSQRCECAYCRTSIKKKFHLDHIVALTRGGTHELSNWQLLCPKCNTSKGSKDAIDFARTKGLLL